MLHGGRREFQSVGVNRARVLRVEGEVNRADVVAFVEDFLPVRSAVTRAIYTAVRIRAVGVSERCDENEFRIPRIDEDAADLPRVIEADVRPRLACVGGFVDAVAERDLRTHVGLARSNIKHVRIRRRDADCPDRWHGLRVENRIPGAARIFRFPDAAADRAEIESVRLPRHAADGIRAAAAERPNHSPVQPGKKAFGNLLRK